MPYCKCSECVDSTWPGVAHYRIEACTNPLIRLGLWNGLCFQRDIARGVHWAPFNMQQDGVSHTVTINDHTYEIAAVMPVWD
jgi:hypothetical protein